MEQDFCKNNLYAVKVPVFSGEKLADVDIYLGPEMKSTGEVLGVDTDLDVAIYKGFTASGTKVRTEGGVYVSLKEVDKEEGTQIIKKYFELGFKIYSSEGTGEYLKQNGIDCEIIDFAEVKNHISKKDINLVINTPTKGNNFETEGFKIRRKATEFRVPVFTCIDTAKAYLTAINVKKSGKEIIYRPMNYYL